MGELDYASENRGYEEEEQMSEIFKPHPIEAYQQWIRLIADQDLGLNEWEVEFCISLHKRLDSGLNLTQAQAMKLESIYVRTS